MSVTVVAEKTVAFHSPYVGKTFQNLTKQIVGRSGYVEGGLTSDNGATITVEPCTFVQEGLFVTTTVTASGIAVPSGSEPWFVLASSPDDGQDTGAIISVTTDLANAATGTVIAFKASGVWQNPVPVNIPGASAKAAETGVETGVVPYFTLDVSDNMDEFFLNRGRVVDPDGIRRDLPRDINSSAKAFSFTPVRAHASKGRQDYVVLRQREPFSAEIQHVLGGLIDDGTYTPKSVSGTRYAYYAKRGGAIGEQWFARGDGSDLRIEGGPGGEAFADAVLLTASGALGEAWIAGQRASDDAIILLYTDGDNVRVVSFNAATGAQIDAPVTIDTQANTCKRVRAELDGNELLHVVYEHNEGAREQIYYTRVSTASATWGNPAITPRIVNGSDTGKNDTYPDIDIDRFGNAHIVYTSGTGSNTFGDLVYAVIDQNGNLTTNDTYLVASTVGKQADVDDNIGFVSTAYTSIQRARVTVTDFDEVFAAMCADESGSFDQLLLFSPGFEERLGFPIVNILSSQLAASLYTVDIESNEQGELRLAAASVSLPSFTIYEIGLDSLYAPDGLIRESVLRVETIDTVSLATQGVGTDEEDIIVRRGPVGDIQISYRNEDNNVTTVVEVGTAPNDSFLVKSHPHGKDLYLSSFEIPDNGTGVLPEEVIRLFNVSKKRMNYPFLVGIDGDFQGYDALFQAVNAANGHGGEIVIRKGDYRNLATSISFPTLTLNSGVTVRGEGKVVLHDTLLALGSAGSFSVASIDGNIIECASASPLAVVRDGDIVQLTGGGTPSGFHVVLAVLPLKGSNPSRFLLDNSSPGNNVPSGTTFLPFPAGNKLENLIFAADGTSARISVEKSYQAILRDIAFLGQATGSSSDSIVSAADSHDLLIQDVDFSKLENTSAHLAIKATNTVRTVILGCKGDPSNVNVIDIDDTNSIPSVYLCSGMTVAAPGGARTTPLLTAGVDDGDTAGLAAATDEFTNVGSVLKSSPGKTLHFQDDNTRSGSTTNIQMSSSLADGDKLPSGKGGTVAVDSLLDAVHIAEHNQREQFLAGIISGGEPTLGAFPLMNVAASVYFANGLQVDKGADSETSATLADTVYYWHLDGTGAFTRTTSMDGFSATSVLVAKAKTNPGNTAFIEFADMRRFFGTSDRKGPILIGPGSTVEDAGYLHFFSLKGALHWLEENATLDMAEIVITGQLDLTGTSELPFTFNFQSSGMKSLIIRGIGEDAGISSDQDEDLFQFTGLAAKNDPSVDPGQKSSLRISNLLLDNSNSSGPTADKAAFQFVDGYFTDVCIDNIRTWNNANSWAHFVRHDATIIDQCTIADNVVDDGRVTVLDFAESGSTVQNLYVLRNSLRNASGAITGTRGIDISSDCENAWIVENIFEPGRVTDTAAFENPIYCAPSDVTNAPNVGSRFVLNNIITHTELTSGDPDFAIRFVAGTGTPGPVYIAGNQVMSSHNGGVRIDNGGALYARVVNNHLDVSSGAAGSVGIEIGSADSLIEGNTVLIGNIGDVGIYIGADSTVATGNRVVGDGVEGIYISSGDNVLVEDNHIDGSYSLAGIRVNTGVDGTGIVSNYVKNTEVALNVAAIYFDGVNGNISCNRIIAASAGFISYLNSSTYIFTGNYVRCTGTDTVSSTAALFRGTLGTIAGNGFYWEENVAATSTPVVELFAEDLVFTGNLVRARMDADYGVAGGGQIGLKCSSPNQVVSGNEIMNRGTDSTKTTVEMGGATSLCFVGNLVQNISASPVRFNGTATGAEFGTAGAATPGANQQV